MACLRKLASRTASGRFRACRQRAAATASERRRAARQGQPGRPRRQQAALASCMQGVTPACTSSLISRPPPTASRFHTPTPTHRQLLPAPLAWRRGPGRFRVAAWAALPAAQAARAPKPELLVRIDAAHGLGAGACRPVACPVRQAGPARLPWLQTCTAQQTSCAGSARPGAVEPLSFGPRGRSRQPPRRRRSNQLSSQPRWPRTSSTPGSRLGPPPGGGRVVATAANGPRATGTRETAAGRNKTRAGGLPSKPARPGLTMQHAQHHGQRAASGSAALPQQLQVSRALWQHLQGGQVWQADGNVALGCLRSGWVAGGRRRSCRQGSQRQARASGPGVASERGAGRACCGQWESGAAHLPGSRGQMQAEAVGWCPCSPARRAGMAGPSRQPVHPCAVQAAQDSATARPACRPGLRACPGPHAAPPALPKAQTGRPRLLAPAPWASGPPCGCPAESTRSGAPRAAAAAGRARRAGARERARRQGLA